MRDRTLSLVRALPREISLTELARDCGLPLAWLTAFARGEIDDPSVNRIQCLYEHLTDSTLELR